MLQNPIEAKDRPELFEGTDVWDSPAGQIAKLERPQYNVLQRNQCPPEAGAPDVSRTLDVPRREPVLAGPVNTNTKIPRKPAATFVLSC